MEVTATVTIFLGMVLLIASYNERCHAVLSIALSMLSFFFVYFGLCMLKM